MADKPTDERLDKSLEAAKPTPAGITNVAKMMQPSRRTTTAKQVVVDDNFDYQVAFNFAFLGSGQGGGRIANAFWTLGYRRVAVLNTTDSDFKGIAEEISKLNLESGGARKDAAFAAAQLKGREEEVYDLLTRAWGNQIDYAFICVGLGGGTGSGTADPLVRIARQYMTDKGKPVKVGAIVSLPTPMEGQQQGKNAVNTFRALLALGVSPLIVIDNGKIDDIHTTPDGRKLSVTQLYPTANQNVSTLLHVFNQLAAVHSDHLTFDQSELGQLLDGGICVMGSADLELESIKSPADVSAKIRDELSNNVLATMDLRRGHKAACLFVGHPSVLAMLSRDYFEAGFTQLNRVVGASLKDKSGVLVHRGLYDGHDEGLQVYTMVSELEPPLDRLAQLAKVGTMGDSVATPKGIAAYLGVQD